jgi:hypothetical protein
MIVGGTSIFGGLGQEPAETSARLFIWDPTTHQKTFDIAPFEGCGAITGLFVGPDNHLWGLACGELFIWDMSQRKIIFSKRLFERDTTPRHIWRDAFFVKHPGKQIYGTSGGRLFRLDPATKDISILRREGANLLSMDRQGRLYFADNTHLWQCIVDDSPPQ